MCVIIWTFDELVIMVVFGTTVLDRWFEKNLKFFSEAKATVLPTVLTFCLLVAVETHNVSACTSWFL